MTGRQVQDNAFTVLMASGFTAIPGILLRSYKQIGLSDEEMMLLLHLIQFRQEGVEFPTSNQLNARMTLNEEVLMQMLYRLIKLGFLEVDETKGLGQDAYDLRPLYRKLCEMLEPPQMQQPVSSLDLLEKKDYNLFHQFEQEFGRPLSPLEYEKIVRWIDDEQYREELIREALREAVLSGKFNFKYIDRILFEWQKQNIRTMQELNVHREQFRNRIPSRGGNAGSGNAQNKGREKAQEKQNEGQGNKYDAFYRMYGGRE